jgi:hypothetical protein
MGYVYTDVIGHCKKTVQPDNFVRTDSLKKKYNFLKKKYKFAFS